MQNKLEALHELVGCKGGSWGILADCREEVENLPFGRFEEFYQKKLEEEVRVLGRTIMEGEQQRREDV